MKAVFLFFVLAIVGSAKAQTLKDALFGGKLKTDTGTVIKKGDSLKLKKDLPQKVTKDSLKNKTEEIDSVKTSSTDTTTSAPVKVLPADNNKIWKQFVDEYTGIIKTDVLPSKKIKKDTYYVLIDYEIETDGSVTTVDISCSPESSYLVEQIKTRMMANAPKLNPVLMGNGKPRKAFKKQMLTLVKDRNN